MGPEWACAALFAALNVRSHVPDACSVARYHMIGSLRKRSSRPSLDAKDGLTAFIHNSRLSMSSSPHRSRALRKSLESEVTAVLQLSVRPHIHTNLQLCGGCFCNLEPGSGSSISATLLSSSLASPTCSLSKQLAARSNAESRPQRLPVRSE